MGLPAGTGDKESQKTQETQRGGFVPGFGRYPGEGNGNPLQYSRLGNSMDSGAWGATVHEVTKSRTELKKLSMQVLVAAHGVFICGMWDLAPQPGIKHRPWQWECRVLTSELREVPISILF